MIEGFKNINTDKDEETMEDKYEHVNFPLLKINTRRYNPRSHYEGIKYYIKYKEYKSKEYSYDCYCSNDENNIYNFLISIDNQNDTELLNIIKSYDHYKNWDWEIFDNQLKKLMDELNIEILNEIGYERECKRAEDPCFFYTLKLLCQFKNDESKNNFQFKIFIDRIKGLKFMQNTMTFDVDYKITKPDFNIKTLKRKCLNSLEDYGDKTIQNLEDILCIVKKDFSIMYNNFK